MLRSCETGAQSTYRGFSQYPQHTSDCCSCAAGWKGRVSGRAPYSLCEDTFGYFSQGPSSHVRPRQSLGRPYTRMRPLLYVSLLQKWTADWPCEEKAAYGCLRTTENVKFRGGSMQCPPGGIWIVVLVQESGKGSPAVVTVDDADHAFKCDASSLRQQRPHTATSCRTPLSAQLARRCKLARPATYLPSQSYSRTKFEAASHQCSGRCASAPPKKAAHCEERLVEGTPQHTL